VLAAALWFGGDTIETNDYLLVSRHPVSGLNAQAPVRYRGVTVGKVIDIKFDALEPRAILVKISVQAGTPLTMGTYAQLGSQGVTGLSYVILDDDGRKPEPLTATQEGLARIEVRPSFIDSVSASGQSMIENFDAVAKRIAVLLSDDNQKQLASTLRNVDRASGRLAELATALEPTLKALPAVVDETGNTMKHADGLITNLNQRVAAFEQTAKSIQQLSSSGIALTEAMAAESLPRLNVLLEDLQRSSHGLERLLGEINEQPQSLIFGKAAQPPGPGEPGFASQRSAR